MSLIDSDPVSKKTHNHPDLEVASPVSGYKDLCEERASCMSTVIGKVPETEHEDVKG